MDKEAETVLGFVDWGVASRPASGEADTGDRAIVHPSQHGILIAVVDGLGHGSGAASAAEIAIDTLRAHAHEPIISLVNLCHKRLHGSRGVVMSMASVNVQDGTMAWIGVGNIEGLLLRAQSFIKRPYESLLLQRGVVGMQLPPLHATVTSIMRGDTLLFVTDGIRTGFLYELPLCGHPQTLADHILNQYGKHQDDALVLVARYTASQS
jgi:negative regulator of sigma-B (phosphoserine phosphatase)